MPTWFCWYIRCGSCGERTTRCTQKPTSSCGRGQSARRPLLRGAQFSPPSCVSNRLMPCTIAQKWFGSVAVHA